MTPNVMAAIAAQGLDATDLEANRSGRVTEKQIARQIEVRRRGALGVWLTVVGAVVICGVLSAWKLTTGDRGAVIVMSCMGFFLTALPLGIYYGFRFVNPEKLRTCTVTRLDNVPVGSFLASMGWKGGVYAIGLNGKRYSGFSNALRREHLGARVNAYVVQEHAIVLALEPIA